jgi:hypothetical protein
MRIFVCATVLAASILAGGAHGADFQKGLKAYFSGNYAAALEEWAPLAEQGHPKAQHNIGVMQRDGQALEKDPAEAVKWFRKAAEQGYFKAQNNLAFMYRDGRGIPRDNAKAVEWFLKSAAQGNVVAQSNLGNMYRDGKGVPQDDAKAVEWWLLAAKQGDAIAQGHLGFMYNTGRGVVADYVASYALYSLAATGGVSWASDYRKNLTKLMTPGQVAEARRIANAGLKSALESADSRVMALTKINSPIGTLLDRYATLAGGLHLNRRCKFLAANLRGEFEELVSRLAIGLGSKVKPGILRVIQKTARKTSNRPEYADCGKNADTIVVETLVLARRIASAGLKTTSESADARAQARRKHQTTNPLSNLTDQQFRKIINLSLEKSSRVMGQSLIARAPRLLIASNIQWLQDNAHRLAPGMLYAFAIRMLPHDPDKAVFWWRVARLRFTFDSALCRDRSVSARSYNYDHQFKGAVRQQGLTNLRTPVETTLAALNWIENNSNHEVSLIGHCTSGLQGIGVAMKQRGLDKKSPWDNTGPAKTMPGHLGRVEIAEPPKVTDESKWVRPKGDQAKIISDLRKRIRDQLGKAIKNQPKQ